jgi:hypothetical protein
MSAPRSRRTPELFEAATPCTRPRSRPEFPRDAGASRKLHPGTRVVAVLVASPSVRWRPGTYLIRDNRTFELNPPRDDSAAA